MVVAAIGNCRKRDYRMAVRIGARHDINVRGAFMHMAADAMVSLGVVIAGALIVFTGRLWIDPVVSIAVAIVILWGTFGLLKQSTAMSLSGVPEGIHLPHVQEALAGIAGVENSTTFTSGR